MNIYIHIRIYVYKPTHLHIYIDKSDLSATSLKLDSDSPFFCSGKNVFQTQHQASADSTIKYRFLYSHLNN